MYTSADTVKHKNLTGILMDIDSSNIRWKIFWQISLVFIMQYCYVYGTLHVYEGDVIGNCCST